MQPNKLITTITAFSLLILSTTVFSEDKSTEKKNSKDSVSAEKSVKDPKGTKEASNPTRGAGLTPSEMERFGRPR